MNEHERLRLLHEQINREPYIECNCERWLIAAHAEEDNSVTFYATRFDEVGAVVNVKGESWVNINDSLSMAYTYALVLDTLEAGINGTDPNDKIVA